MRCSAQANAVQIGIPVIIAVVDGATPWSSTRASLGRSDPGPPELGGLRAVAHDAQGPCWPRPEH
jgi:hypothetical protein